MGDALAGRLVLVTGSSRGIGAEIAVKAAAAGATVAVHGFRTPDGAARTLARVREAGAEGEVFSANVAARERAKRSPAGVREQIAHALRRQPRLGARRANLPIPVHST